MDDRMLTKPDDEDRRFSLMTNALFEAARELRIPFITIDRALMPQWLLLGTLGVRKPSVVVLSPSLEMLMALGMETMTRNRDGKKELHMTPVVLLAFETDGSSVTPERMQEANHSVMRAFNRVRFIASIAPTRR